MENSVDKSQGISHSIHKSTHPNTSYSSQGSSWSNSKGKKEGWCFKCRGFGCFSFECPGKALSLPNEGQALEAVNEEEFEEVICWDGYR